MRVAKISPETTFESLWFRCWKEERRICYSLLYFSCSVRLSLREWFSEKPRFGIAEIGYG